MPSGVYKRTDKNLKGIRDFNATKIGKKRPPRSNEWIENIKKTRMVNPIRNWKGGLTRDKNYVKWSQNLRNKRRRLKNNNLIGHNFGEWENLKAQYNWTCPCCKRSEPEIKLTEDHIIPLSKGGSDNIENIQPLCRSCNSKKHTLIIKY